MKQIVALNAVFQENLQLCDIISQFSQCSVLQIQILIVCSIICIGLYVIISVLFIYIFVWIDYNIVEKNLLFILRVLTYQNLTEKWTETKKNREGVCHPSLIYLLSAIQPIMSSVQEQSRPECKRRAYDIYLVSNKYCRASRPVLIRKFMLHLMLTNPTFHTNTL